MQQTLALEIADILSAAREKAEILEPLERRADIGIDRLHPRAQPSRMPVNFHCDSSSIA